MATGLALDFANGGQEVDLGDELESRAPVLPDVETQPDAVNALTARALEEETEDFTIKGPPDGSAQLIAGYVDPTGTRWTSVEIRELRGRDEEAMARAMATGDLVRWIDAILRAGIVRIGEVEGEKDLKAALDTLLVGDRDLLVLQVRRMAYGDTIRLSVKCPFCEDLFDVDYSFSEDVPLKAFEVEGVTDRNQRLFDIELPSGVVAEIRLVDGKAQKTVYTPENAQKTDAELNTLLLAELIVSLDGKAVRGVGPVLDLTVKDRSFLLKWLSESQPGPQYGDVRQECPKCVREFPLVVSLREMFRGD